MCGIAGLIHRGKSTNIGGEMKNMLQSLKHRGPDSTGYALYSDNISDQYILRFKVGENVKEGSSAVKEDPAVYEKRRDAKFIKHTLSNSSDNKFLISKLKKKKD